jgi:hypothetical protein
MINDDDFMPSNDKRELTPINKERLNERIALEESECLLVNELFRNINDASINDTPIINYKINVIAEKLKRVKRDNIIKDQLGTERRVNKVDKHPADKRSRFADNLKKNKLLAIKIGSMIDRIDEVEDDEAEYDDAEYDVPEYDDTGYYDIEDNLLNKR